MQNFALILLLLLIPFSSYKPVGLSSVDGVLTETLNPGLFLSDIAVVAVLIIGALDKVQRGLEPFEISAPLLGIVSLAYLTAPWAISPRFALYTAFRWSLAFGIYFMFSKSSLSQKRIAQFFVAGLAVHAMIGLLQVLAQRPLGLPGEMALPVSKSYAGIIEVEGGRWLRAYGLTFHPNVLGGFMVVGLVMCLPLLSQRVFRYVWWLLWVGLFLSFSRSAWLAAAVSIPVAVALCLRSQESKQGLLRAGIGAVIVLGLLGVVWNEQLSVRFQPLYRMPLQSVVRVSKSDMEGLQQPAAASAEKSSIRARLDQIETAVGVIANRPLQGIGAGNFPFLMWIRGFDPENVHNVPLLLASEIGVLGGGIWLALLVLGGTILAARWQNSSSWTLLLLSAWLGLGIISLFDFYPWGLNAGRLLTVMVLGLAGRSIARENLESDR